MFDQLDMSVRTALVDDTDAIDDMTDNVFGLAPDVLKKRKVQVIHIEEVQDCLPADQGPEEDPTITGCAKADRPPLQKGWYGAYKKEGRPRMCVYKLVTTSFKYWGVQDRLESVMQKKGFGETFYKMHRPMLPWMNEWYGMTKDDIRVYEERTRVFLEQLKQGEAVATPTAAGETEAVPQEQERKSQMSDLAQPVPESCWSITAPQHAPLPPDAPISDILEAILQRQTAMDLSQQQMMHHMGVMSKYLDYQQQMLDETRDICSQVVTATASMPHLAKNRKASDDDDGGGGNVFTKMFTFGSSKSDST